MNQYNQSKYKSSAILYTFSYMAIGGFTPLIGLYLHGLGFSGAQIGLVTAIGTAIAIFAVAIWGRIYSITSSKVMVIEILCFCSICMVAILSQTSTFFIVILCYGLLYFFQSPIMSLVDSFTALSEESNNFEGKLFEDKNINNNGFGSKRAWGAVGFALGVFISGKLISITTDKIIFVLYGVSFAIAMSALALIRRKKSKNFEAINASSSDDAPLYRKSKGLTRGKSKGYIDLMCDSNVVKLLICMFFFGGTNVANNTYFSFLYIDGGGTVAGVGIAMLLMVGSEVPFMFWSERISNKFSIERIILIAMMISVVRFILYGVGLPWYLLIALFFTQGAVNGILLVEFVRYIAKIAPADCRSLAISAYYIIGSNISTIVCQFIGGLILDSFGATGVYLFFGIFNLVGVILYLCFGLQKPHSAS